MNVSKCYNCGTDQQHFYTEENGYLLVKCDSCGLLFVKNRPDENDILQAHKQGKHVGIHELDVTGSFDIEKIPKYLRVLEELFVEGFGSGKTWLDVGCGHGEFMEAVQIFGSGKVKVKGMEPNVIKQESARKRGLNVGYFDIDLHEESYDIISILNVYSHLPNPPAFLNSLKMLLKPGGELIVQTGDIAVFSPKDIPRPLDLPDHLSFASEGILIDILDRIGFDIVRIIKYPFLDQCNLNRIARELAKAVLPQYKSKLRYYLKWKTYSQVDMFIRGRARTS